MCYSVSVKARFIYEKITELTSEITQKAYKEFRRTNQSGSMHDMYRELDHIRWMRFYTYYNWEYDPVRNDTTRQHPMLCPYHQLTPAQKRERDAAWEILGSIASEIS